MPDGTCDKCPTDHYYLSDDGKFCLKCDDTCLRCNGKKADNCTYCKTS